ncbi:MAG: hypothetical protein ACPGYX_08820, partial [Oceanobacter sp.]
HRERGPLYVQRADNSWCNDFSLKLESFMEGTQTVRLSVRSLSMGENAFELNGPDQIELDSATQGQWLAYRVCAINPKQQSDMLEFRAESGDIVQLREARFILGM